jgi:hypothetical protein
MGGERIELRSAGAKIEFELPCFEAVFGQALRQMLGQVVGDRDHERVLAGLTSEEFGGRQVAKIEFLGSDPWGESVEGLVVGVKLENGDLVPTGPVIRFPGTIRTDGGRARFSVLQLEDYMIQALEAAHGGAIARAFRWRVSDAYVTVVLRERDVVVESSVCLSSNDRFRTGNQIVLSLPFTRAELETSIRESAAEWVGEVRPKFEHPDDLARRLGYTGWRQMDNKTDSIWLVSGVVIQTDKVWAEVHYSNPKWRADVSMGQHSLDDLVAALFGLID